MDLHVNKLTDAVNSLSSATSNNLDKDGQDQRVRESPENPDNSDIVEVDKVLTIYEDDRTLYQEHKEITEKAFLETPSKNDPIFSAAIKDFLTLTMQMTKMGTGSDR